MARNVTDAAVLLGAMTGIDPKDAATAAQAGHAFTDYTQFLDENALKGARIGVWRSDDTYDRRSDPAIDAIFERHGRRRSKSLGRDGRRPARDLTSSPRFNREFAALLCEFKTDIASYLQTYTAAGYPKTLQDLIDFNNAHPELEGPVEQRHLRPRPGDRRAGRSRLHRRPRGDDAGRPGGDRRRRWPPTTSTRSSRRRTARPGSPIRSTATASTGFIRRLVEPVGGQPATPASPFAAASSGRCPSASRSSAAAGTSRS